MCWIMGSRITSGITDNVMQQSLHVLDYGKPDNIRHNRQRYATIIACAGLRKAG